MESTIEIICYQCDTETVDLPSPDGQVIYPEDLEKLGWQWWGSYREQPTCPTCIEAAENAAEDEDNRLQEDHDRMIAAVCGVVGSRFIGVR